MENIGFMIGKNIRDRREKLGIGQEALAKETGLTVKSISEIENGHSWPRPNNLEGIAKALKCTPHELLNIQKSVERDSLGDIIRLLIAFDENQLAQAKVAIEALRMGNIRKSQSKKQNRLG